VTSDELRIIDELHREIAQTNRGLIALHTELEAAREAEARLAAIVRSSDDAIFSASVDGLIQTWNPGAERLLGRAAEDMAGRPVGALFVEDQVEAFELVLAGVLRGEHRGAYETRCQPADGSPIDVSISVSAMLDAGGGVLGVSVVLRDITERLRVSAQLAQARSEQQVAEERDRIAVSLSEAVIKQLFATEMKLAGAADRITDGVARDRVTESIRDIDETINRIRRTIFWSDPGPGAPGAPAAP